MEFYDPVPINTIKYSTSNQARKELLLEVDKEISKSQLHDLMFYSQSLKFTSRSSVHLSNVASFGESLPNPFAKPKAFKKISPLKIETIKAKAITQKSIKPRDLRIMACKYLQSKCRSLIKTKDDLLANVSVERRKSKQGSKEEMILCAPIITKRVFHLSNEVLCNIEQNLNNIFNDQHKEGSINSFHFPSISESKDSSFSSSDLPSPYFKLEKTNSEYR